MNENDRLTIDIILTVCETSPTFKLPADFIARIQAHPGLVKAIELAGLEILDGRLVRREGQ
jgi:hypothetical protein